MGRGSGIAVLSLLAAALVLVGAIPTGSIAIAAGGPFIVSSTLDAVDDAPGDGVCHAAGDICTLRAAVQESNASVGLDTIQIPAGTYTLTIEGMNDDTGATGDLDITDAAEIVGDDASTTIVDGNAIDRVLHVLTADGVTLSGVTIQHGYAGTGGGIANEVGLLTLKGVTIQSNEGEDGGGIWNAGGLSVSSSNISDNTAGYDGGGVHTENGAVDLTDVAIERNDALVQGGGIVSYGGQVMMTGGTVSGNDALYAGGGGILAFDATVTLFGVDVSANSGDGAAFGGPGAEAGGVGMYDGSLEIHDSHIESNYIYGSGGGIFVENSAFTIDGGTVSGNTARFGGGIHGTGTISNVAIADNYVEATFGEGGFGGGVYGGGALVNVTISGNIVETGDDVGSSTYAARGTAIYGSASFVNVTIADNAAATVAGPDAAPASPLFATGPLELVNTIVADASLLGCAGAPVTSLGHNLDRGTTCGFTAAGDQSNVDPLLGPLAGNGGLSPTHALLPGSPAIDAGDDASCPAVDQRGLSRPVDGNGDGTAVCDIGAYEVQKDEVPTDTSAPVITPDVVGDLGLDGWYVSDVTVSWSVIDDESAVSETDGCDVTTIASDTAEITLTCTATSAGGTAQQSVTLKRDATAPVIATPSDIDATATSRSGANVPYDAPVYEDALSGSGTATCTPASGSRFRLGKTSVRCSAADAAGNTTTRSFRVLVTYAWSGLRPPISADGTTVAKAGSTIPLKFRLTGASANVTNALATLTVERLSDGYTPIRGARFQYQGQQYTYHWKTKGLAPGEYRLTINLGDGDTTRTVVVRLR